MLRVLRLRQEDPLVWQKALLLSEAEEVSAPMWHIQHQLLHVRRTSQIHAIICFLQR